MAPSADRTLHVLGRWQGAEPFKGWLLQARGAGLDALPADAVACTWDLLDRSRLARLIRLSGRCPLVRVACIDEDGRLAGNASLTRSRPPGWCGFVSWSRLPAFVESDGGPHGLGPHHFGIHWTGEHAAVAEALGDLFEAPDRGPPLVATARRLGVNATSLGRAIEHETGWSYAALRTRRSLALAGRSLACDGTTFAVAAGAVGWTPPRLLEAFVRHDLSWRDFTGEGARTRLRQAIIGILAVRGSRGGAAGREGP